jgi:predicted AAA+ superfamily ATPase
MSPQAYRLKPWTEVVRPHDDIVAGNLEMSTYAADLGAVDRQDPNTPRIYRDPREFFRTTYPTRNLRELFRDVLGVLAGRSGDRVIQLRTPFGGGKTHALLGLYHLVASRATLSPSDLDGIPDPGPGRVAVLSGLDLDPRTPRVVDGLAIRTLWGELAFRLGGQPAYEKVRVHDETGTAPGGNVLRSVIGTGPVLILLDEVLVYVERAGGKTGADPLRRQVTLFLQALTEVVRNLPHAATVYSLQASVHEAAGDEALLQQLDHLVTRVDAKREPVSDDEVMRVVQRRLFPSFGEDPAHQQVAREVAREYAIAYRRLREGAAETEGERRAAGQEAERFEARILDSYPFHPDLLDLMYHRWGSLPSYQRTRGALQFLARVVHAVWDGARPPRPLIGPSDVPLEDEHVRGAFFSQVGERERYSSVLSADITGDGARCREVDRRIAADSPAFEQLRVGTRCATAIMLYSFGAREGEDRGVLESELVPSLVAPDLDRNVTTTALHDLREELLYLHHTGRRYRFEPKANLNLLIAEESKKWQPEEVLERVKKELAQLLAPAADRALLWPEDSKAIPDGEPVFRVAYLAPAFTELDEAEIMEQVRSLVDKHGPGHREYRNAIAFAVPGRNTLDRARAAARLLLAIGSLLTQVKSKRLALEREQVDELTERQKGVAADLAGAVERLYEQVLVPVPDRQGAAPFALDTMDLRAQLTAGRDLHARILDALRKHVFDALTPARLVALAKLGQERDFVATEELVKWFFSYFDFPKLKDETALRDAIARGTADMLGYVSAAHMEEGAVVPSRTELVRFGAPTPEDEIDLGPGCFVLAPTLAINLRGEKVPEEGASEAVAAAKAEECEKEGVTEAPSPGGSRYRLRVETNAPQLFRILPALQNLADRASRFVARIDVEAESEAPFDKSWLRNAVEEHLDEAGVEGQTSLE